MTGEARETREMPVPRLMPPAPGDTRWRLAQPRIGVSAALAAVVAGIAVGAWEMRPVGEWLLAIANGGAL